jgi:hypothetical protein
VSAHIDPSFCMSCGGTGKRHPEAKNAIRCHDCKNHFSDYTVREEVWAQAWPEYKQMKAELSKKYKGTNEFFRAHLFLCFACLERRLGRVLTPADFDLSIPTNQGIALGLQMR